MRMTCDRCRAQHDVTERCWLQDPAAMPPRAVSGFTHRPVSLRAAPVVDRWDEASDDEERGRGTLAFGCDADGSFRVASLPDPVTPPPLPVRTPVARIEPVTAAVVVPAPALDRPSAPEPARVPGERVSPMHTLAFGRAEVMASAAAVAPVAQSVVSPAVAVAPAPVAVIEAPVTAPVTAPVAAPVLAPLAAPAARARAVVKVPWTPLQDAPASVEADALTVVCRGAGAALLVAAGVAAWAALSDGPALALAGSVLLLTSFAEMPASQRPWSCVAIVVPLALVEVAATRGAMARLDNVTLVTRALAMASALVVLVAALREALTARLSARAS